MLRAGSNRSIANKRVKRSLLISLSGFVLLLIVLPVAQAQGTRADYERAERFLPWNLKHHVFDANVRPHWIKDSNRFWYERSSPEGKEFRLIDPGRDTAVPAFDHEKLAAALSRATRRTYKSTELPFNDFDFDDTGSTIAFTLEKQPWSCSLKNYECAKKRDERRDSWEVLSPDHKWASSVKNHNLYLRDVSTGQEVQLTSDGEEHWDYATPLPSLRLMVEQGTEEPRQHAAVFWSPDSSKLVTYRIDSRQAGRFTSLQFVPADQLRPRAFTYVYPLPGEALARAQPVIFDIVSARRVDVQTEPLEIFFLGGPDFTWYKDSKRFYYLFYSRGFKRAEWREVDAESGKQRTVVTEDASAYVDPNSHFVQPLKNGAEVLWSSERDGWNHLYLYDGQTGQLKNRVTEGNWTVRRIEYVDEKARQAYFLAGGREAGEDPYQTHLYRTNLDGSNLRLVTSENANHSAIVSPDGAYIVDNYSRPDLPGESVLRRTSDGAAVRVLEQTEAGELLKTGWKFPEAFHGKAADGKTDIYGLIWRASNFDPSLKYPVIEQIYTGPQGFFVPKTFAAYRRSEQPLAELGFVVVMVDGRGTAGRWRAFHEFSYRNLGGVFDDHVALIRQMAAKYPYMDLSRVGIYGTSAGAYGATHAMLAHPEFYKVGVSISGDHDARLDKAWWNELYQGYPIQEDYIAQSNVTMAEKLQGHLLLVHGDIDENVHPVGTLRLIDALKKANKNFDMLLIPNEFHGEGGDPYLIRRRWDYFVKYLLGVEPPPDFQIRRDTEQSDE